MRGRAFLGGVVPVKEKWVIAVLVGLGLLFMTRKAWAIPVRGRKFAALFQAAERAHGLPRDMLARMAQQESSFNPKAVSPAGAQGLMQIVPRWHPGIDPFNVEQSIFYAGKFLAANYKRFGTWPLALAAYNWGPGNVAKIKDPARWPEETRSYVAKITRDVNDNIQWA